MKIIIAGSGGVGGYFGAKLAKAGADVTFMARGEHLKAMQNYGLIIDSAEEGKWQIKVRATDELPNQETADLIMLCVKSYDTESMINQLKPVVGANTMIMSLQNGIDNEQKIGDMVSASNVLGGVAYIFANISSPGVIQHHQMGQIKFGKMDGSLPPNVVRISRILNEAGIDAEATPNINQILWQKYIFLVALSGTTTLARVPVKVISENSATYELWKNQIVELLSLAKAEGLNFDSDMVEKFSSLLNSLSPGNYSSLYHDLMNGKRLELSALHGYAAQLGKRHNVPTPTIDAVFGALSPHIDGQ